MSILDITSRALVSAVIGASLAIGLAATAGAQPAQSDKESDFWGCAAEHPDDIGVCCVFYGGDYDERTKECYIDFAQTKAPTTRPTKPRLPVLTPVKRLPAVSAGALGN